MTPDIALISLDKQKKILHQKGKINTASRADFMKRSYIMNLDISSNPLTAEFKEFMKNEKCMANLVLGGYEKAGEKTALRWYKNGKWADYTWKEFGNNSRAIGKSLMNMGFGKGDMIGIFSQNRPEWHFADVGICSTRAASVPIYATNSAPEAEYIVNDAELKAIFVGNQEQYDRIMTFFEKSTLQKVIAFDRSIKISGEQSVYLDDFIDEGDQLALNKELDDRIANADPDDIFTLIYTSGTTGNPKGAIHTNESFMAGICANTYRFSDVEGEMVSLSFLPLSHVFERMWSYGVFYFKMENHYCEDPKEIMDVLAASRPHYMCSVPRIWEKIYATIYDKIETAPPVKQKLFHWSVKTAGEAYSKKVAGENAGLGLKIKKGLADALVLKKIKDALVGGRAIAFHSGGAACPTSLKVFFNSIGIPVCEGFGLTEFFPVCVGRPETAKDQYCGPVIAMVDLKISDEGELLLKGKNAMKGYYKKPEATAECFTEDGWFRTGDVAEIYQEGIKITDRIKDIIITAGGKNISPQQIEGLFGSDLYIEQIAVIGEKRKYISALVVPSFEVLEEYAKNNNISFSSREDLITKPEIIDFYAKRIDEHTESLGQVEKIKKFTLLPREFSQEEGEITPTFKIKRKVIDKKFQDTIEKMYS